MWIKIMAAWTLTSSVVLAQAGPNVQWPNQMPTPPPTNGSVKDMKHWYNQNARAWNDWFGKGNTRYRFYADMDVEMQMQMEWWVRMNAANRARHNARQRAQAQHNGLANGQGYMQPRAGYTAPYYPRPYPRPPVGYMSRYPQPLPVPQSAPKP